MHSVRVNAFLQLPVIAGRRAVNTVASRHIYDLTRPVSACRAICGVATFWSVFDVFKAPHDPLARVAPD